MSCRLSVQKLELEVHSGVDRDGSRSARTCDAAEACGVDVGHGISPYRFVQEIDRVGSYRKRLSFRDPDLLTECKVEAEIPGTSNTG